MITAVFRYTSGDDNQLWLRSDGITSTTYAQIEVSGLPAGAVINSASITFTATSVRYGTKLAFRCNGVSAKVDSANTVAATVAGNGTVSIRFDFNASTTASYATIGIVGLQLTVSYTNPVSSVTLEASSVPAGGTIHAIISAADPRYTHRMQVTFGSETATVEGDNASASLDVPMAWLNQIPNTLSGTAVVTVETLDGDAVMGAASTTCIITCPDTVVPEAGQLTAVGDAMHWGMYIQGVSSARILLADFSPGLGATIKSVYITGGGTGIWADVAAPELSTGMLNTAGVITYTATVTDSRGKTAQATASIEVMAYEPVTITARSCWRSDAGGTAQPVTGTWGAVQINYRMTALGNNAADVKLYYKAAEDAAWIEVADWPDASGHAGTFGAGMLAVDTSYDVRLVVSDAISSAEQTDIIASGQVFQRWEKKHRAIGFGAYPAGTNRVVFADDMPPYMGDTPLVTYLLDLIYPVGCIVPFASSVDPAAMWGGKWELLAEGVTLIQAGTKYPLGTTGGEETVTLTVDQIPAHMHDVKVILPTGESGSTGSGWAIDKWGRGGFAYKPNTLQSVGSGAAHNNMPPYLAVNWWLRVADAAAVSEEKE